jgi:hypothetical protein
MSKSVVTVVATRIKVLAGGFICYTVVVECLFRLCPIFYMALHSNMEADMAYHIGGFFAETTARVS